VFGMYVLTYPSVMRQFPSFRDAIASKNASQNVFSAGASDMIWTFPSGYLRYTDPQGMNGYFSVAVFLSSVNPWSLVSSVMMIGSLNWYKYSLSSRHSSADVIFFILNAEQGLMIRFAMMRASMNMEYGDVVIG